jgi:hypothetical protein
MRGKYTSLPRYLAAYAKRELLRLRLRQAVSWNPLSNPEPGCTAIIGMCHRLPGVLLSNLRCLLDAAWPALSRIIIVVDGAEGCIPKELEARARALATGEISIDVYYYSEAQAKQSEELRLPYVFSWLSWSIALSHCRTKYALIQDYDALVFGDALAQRYDAFLASGAVIQGIKWYEGNGITAADELATTFEAFVDVTWLRERHPLAGFHKVGLRDGVSRDYDTLLHLQHVNTPRDRRAAVPMPEESLVHPSQMIHQYTMFRRSPGAALPCSAMPMIPLFEHLSGDEEAIELAVQRLEQTEGKVVDLFGDGTLVNLTRLDVAQIDWALKQMVRAYLNQKVTPFAALYRYGELLYRKIGTPADKIWVGDFTEAQRAWVDASRRASESAASPLARAANA